MKIDIVIDAEYDEPMILIKTATMTKELDELVKSLSHDAPPILASNKDGLFTILEEDEIIRVYAADGKVYATTRNGDRILRRRLYEVEEQLSPKQFVKISKSELINLKAVRHFDLSRSGTILVELDGGIVTSVSRRFVSKIKTVLGL